MENWIKSVSDEPKRFKRFGAKFAKSGFANPLQDNLALNHNVPAGLAHNCHLCELHTDTFQKVCGHLFKHHGIRNKWRHYIGSLT